jgi:hypothetical protein
MSTCFHVKDYRHRWFRGQREKRAETWPTGSTRLTALPKERESDGTVDAIHMTPSCFLNSGRNGCKIVDQRMRRLFTLEWA